MTDTTDVILQAAHQRFAHDGPSKTTMAAIAHDCGMSVGNLYRHFDNKHAIMVACLTLQLQKKLDAGTDAAANHHCNALDALRAFLQARLQQGHQQFSSSRHLFDLIAVIDASHHDVLVSYEKKVIDAMAHMIKQGIDEHLISCLDAKQTAYDIHQATLRYNNPITLQSHPLKLLQSDLNRLLDLLTMGLHPR